MRGSEEDHQINPEFPRLSKRLLFPSGQHSGHQTKPPRRGSPQNPRAALGDKRLQSAPRVVFGGCVSTGFMKNMVHSIYSMSWRSGITRLLALLTVLQFLVLNFVFTALSCELFVLRRFSLQLRSNLWRFCTRFLLCKLLAFGAQRAISSNMTRLSLSRLPRLWDNWMMSEGRLRQSFCVFTRISYQDALVADRVFALRFSSE